MKTETPNNSNKPSSGAQNSKANSNRTTVKSAIKLHLEAGKPITHNEAQTLYGTSRLGAYIHLLRNEGMSIRTDTIKVKAGTGKPTAHDAHVARYTLVGGE
jgi:hypothetical protein